MNGLIPLERLAPQPVTEDLLALNEITWERGLTLTEEEARELSETRSRALRENDRIEFGSEVMKKLMERFADSRYLDRTNWADVLNEITYYFYYIKAETEDRIGDADLAEEMFTRFELYCRGDIDRFEEKEIERIIRKVNLGKKKYEAWYGEEDALDPADFGRRTPDNLLDDTYAGREEDPEEYRGGMADEIARDEEVDLDVFGDYGEDDGLSAGYANEDDLSLYDEVGDEAAEEDDPSHPLYGGDPSGNRSMPGADRYFTPGRLTGREKKDSIPDDPSPERGSVTLPGGASLSAGDAYPEDFAGFTEDEEAFLTAFLANEEGEPDLDAMDAFIDRMAENEAENGGEDEHE